MTAVDPYLSFAICLQLTAYDKPALVKFQCLLFQKHLQILGNMFKNKDSFNTKYVTSRPNKIHRDTMAKNRTQGIDQYRFSCTRFAGQNI